MMRTLTESGLFFKRRMLQTLRQPTWIFMGLATPLLYLVLFTPLLHGLAPETLSGASVVNTFVPGMLGLLALSSGTGIGWTIVNELSTGVVERLSVSPASRLALLLGTVLRDVVTFIVPACVVVVISAFFGFDIHPAGLLVLAVLLALLTASVSAACNSVGLITKQIGSVAAVVTGLQLPLMLLGGVLLPISLGPTWLQWLAHINPLYYVVEASRDLASGSILTLAVGVAFAVMVALLIAALAWGVRVYQKALAN